VAIKRTWILIVYVALAAGQASQAAQVGTAFTYQGRLTDGGNPANGDYDLQFELYDNNTGPSQVGSTIALDNVSVTDGLFTVQLDFGSAAFAGDARWLQAAVRPGDSSSSYTTLSPLQELTPTAYALWAADAGAVGGVALGDLVQKDQANSLSTVMLQDSAVTAAKLGSIAGYNLHADYDGTVLTLWNNFAGKATLSCRANQNSGTAIVAYADHSGKGVRACTWGGVGVEGYSNNEGTSAGDGVYGYSGGGKGVHGKSIKSYGYGVYGENSSGFAGYFLGKGYFSGNVGIGTTTPGSNLHVEGTIEVDQKIKADDSGGLELATDEGTTRLFINDDGNVGIGTTNPLKKLTVNGNIKLSNNKGLYIANGIDNFDYQLVTVDSNNNIKLGAVNVAMPLHIYAHANERITINSLGVGIWTTSPQGKLDVNGTIYQRGGILHADYVFDPGYQLESIDQHSQHMWKHRHLKAIPEARLDKDGKQIVEVGAHRKGIVEELEKAHIYIDQLHKRIKTLEQQLSKLEARLDRMR